jgi:hypothetical protein
MKEKWFFSIKGLPYKMFMAPDDPPGSGGDDDPPGPVKK